MLIGQKGGTAPAWGPRKEAQLHQERFHHIFDCHRLFPAGCRNLAPKDILFIDEIHRLSRAVEEVLYPAMEDFALDIIIGKGPSARSIRIRCPPGRNRAP